MIRFDPPGQRGRGGGRGPLLQREPGSRPDQHGQDGKAGVQGGGNSGMYVCSIMCVCMRFEACGQARVCAGFVFGYCSAISAMFGKAQTGLQA